jgi:hypothetical protein
MLGRLATGSPPGARRSGMQSLLGPRSVVRLVRVQLVVGDVDRHHDGSGCRVRSS